MAKEGRSMVGSAAATSQLPTKRRAADEQQRQQEQQTVKRPRGRPRKDSQTFASRQQQRRQRQQNPQQRRQSRRHPGYEEAGKADVRNTAPHTRQRHHQQADDDEDQGEEEGVESGDTDEDDNEHDNEDDNEDEEELPDGANSRHGKSKAKQSRNPKTAPAHSTDSSVVYVAQSTVAKKWAPLDDDAQAQVRSLVTAAARSAIATYSETGNSEATAAEAQAAIALAMRAIVKRLPKLTFPAKTVAEMFEYEGLLRDNITMNRQIVSQAADVKNLEAEITRVHQQVKKTEREAREKQADYESEKISVERRHAGKNGPFLRMPDVEPPDSARKIKLAPWTGNAPTTGALGPNKTNIQKLARRLQTHLEDANAAGSTTEKLEADVRAAMIMVDEILHPRPDRILAQDLPAG